MHSSQPNRSSSCNSTTSTRSPPTCSKPSKTASARACKQSRAGSTLWRRPTTRPRSDSTRPSDSSPTSATSTSRPNPPNGGCSTGHCSTASPASPSMTRTRPGDRDDPRRRSQPTQRKTLPRDHAGQSSNVQLYVDAGGLSQNTWKRLERLSAVWEQAKRSRGSKVRPTPKPEVGVVLTPTRRSRTPLTPEEVDALRTARTNGESVTAICRQFGIHRATVRALTKELSRTE